MRAGRDWPPGPESDLPKFGVLPQPAMSVCGRRRRLLLRFDVTGHTPHPLVAATSTLFHRVGRSCSTASPAGGSSSLEGRWRRWQLLLLVEVAVVRSCPSGRFERFEELALPRRSGGQGRRSRRRRGLRREQEFRSGERERVVRRRVGSQKGRERDRRRDSLTAPRGFLKR